MKPRATQCRLQSRNPAQQKAHVRLLAIFHHVHQDSRHPAILSKCTASEFLQSLQSSDELKMYAWVGNIFGVHHNNNLKGKFICFFRGKKNKVGNFRNNLSRGFLHTRQRLQQMRIRRKLLPSEPVFSHRPCEAPKFSRLFLTTVSLKGHS